MAKMTIKKLAELKTEFAPLARMMKEVLGVKVETVIVSYSTVNSPLILTTSEYGFRQHGAYQGLAHNGHNGQWN